MVVYASSHFHSVRSTKLIYNYSGCMGMDDYQNYFDKIEDAAADKRRQQNLDDYHNEMSGNEVGRQSRFLSGDARRALIDKRNGRASRAFSALEALLANDPAYAARYQSVFTKLNEAEAATETALAKAIDRAEAADAALENALDRAMRLEDGTRVFRDGDDVRREDGTVLEDDIADMIEWRGNEPDFAELERGRETARNEWHTVDEVRVYQVDVLGHVRGRLADHKNPPSPEELELFDQMIEDRKPDAVKAEFAVEAVTAVPENSAELSIPELK